MAAHCFCNRERAEELAARIGGHVVQGDLRRPEQAASVVSEAVAALGAVDVCVANSGGRHAPAVAGAGPGGRTGGGWELRTPWE